MKLLIGLGNPGKQYEKNRHNAGQRFVRKANLKLENFNLKSMETNTFMNESGEAVRRWVAFYRVKPEDLYIAHDDLDIPLGEYKIQFGVGPQLHYGIQSVEKELGTKDFWRVRIGVDNRPASRRAGIPRTPGEEYVLQDFTKEELEILEQRAFPKIVEELKAKSLEFEDPVTR